MTDLTARQLAQVFGFTLSEQQWAAVTTGLEPGVMIAGAGSGKTTSMAARIAWLVGSGYVRPDSILGLTFTTKATAQLLESARTTIDRLRTEFPDRVPADCADPVISTYNSFAAGIVTEFGSLLGRDFTGDVLADGARYQLAYRLVCTTDLDLSVISPHTARVTTAMLALDGELSELALEPADVEAHDSQLLDYFGSFTKHNDATRGMIAAATSRRMLARLVDQWREVKASRDLVEFSDQVRLAREIVQRFPEVAETIRSRFSVALLDEYQDTSISQRMLLQSIFGSGFPLTAVGDPCQAIYGWRGASVANINDFTAHFPRAEDSAASVFPLSTNRRSGVRILEAANVISADLRAEHPQVELLDPGRDHPGYLTLALFNTAQEELDWMADRIAEQHATLADTEDIAVLSPTTSYLIRMQQALRDRGVPVQLHSAADLLAEPLIIDVQSLLAVVQDPTANPEFLRWASGVRWRIGARDLAALGKRAAHISATAAGRHAENVDQALAEAVQGIDAVDVNALSDALGDLGDLSQYSAQAVERFGRMADVIRELRSATGLPLVEFIGLVLRVSGIDIQSRLSTSSDREHIAIHAFLDLASDFTDADGRVSLGAFLERLSDIKRFDIDVDFEQPVDSGAVQLLTVYKAKGLEFTHVYLPNMTKESFPGGRKPTNWTTDPSIVPWPIRHDAPDDLAQFPDYTTINWPKRIHSEDYLGQIARYRHLDHDRLAYVAMTRAQDSLTMTSCWWGFGHKKPRGPHQYLQAVYDHCAGLDTDIPIWVQEPSEDPPTTSDRDPDYTWPEPVAAEIVESLTEQARYVSADHTAELAVDTLTLDELTLDELAVVHEWEQSLARLCEETERLESDVRRVPIPRSVGVTTMLRALSEPEALARDLARPMPRPSSVVANKGTLVHALIEQHYSPSSLFDPEDLMESTAMMEADASVEQLRQAFLASRFAAMEPVAVEQAFTISLGGVPVTGFIDAVFMDNGRYLVVDWKTGTSDHVDPMQLALYRIAWARICGIDWQDVDTCFVMLSEGVEITPDTDHLVLEILAQN
ncbi:MAG: UvrD-helicase domain-containing protein [Candidatus Nanopelagicales bacterium]|nr:UvrD-helicase domain-containing protein [Candidatus Nanopelagicales bacterium]